MNTINSTNFSERLFLTLNYTKINENVLYVFNIILMKSNCD